MTSATIQPGGEAFIYEAIRTPRGKGKKDGSLHEVRPVSLLVGLIDEIRNRFPELDEERISDLIVGCVSPVGDQGADIARTAALTAGCRTAPAVSRSTASALQASPPSTWLLRRSAPAWTSSSSPVASNPCPACQ